MTLCSESQLIANGPETCFYMWTSSSDTLGMFVGTGIDSCGTYGVLEKSDGEGLFDAACCQIDVPTQYLLRIMSSLGDALFTSLIRRTCRQRVGGLYNEALLKFHLAHWMKEFIATQKFLYVKIHAVTKRCGSIVMVMEFQIQPAMTTGLKLNYPVKHVRFLQRAQSQLMNSKQMIP